MLLSVYTKSFLTEIIIRFLNDNALKKFANRKAFDNHDHSASPVFHNIWDYAW